MRLASRGNCRSPCYWLMLILQICKILSLEYVYFANIRFCVCSFFVRALAVLVMRGTRSWMKSIYMAVWHRSLHYNVVISKSRMTHSDKHRSFYTKYDYGRVFVPIECFASHEIIRIYYRKWNVLTFVFRSAEIAFDGWNWNYFVAYHSYQRDMFRQEMFSSCLAQINCCHRQRAGIWTKSSLTR